LKQYQQQRGGKEKEGHLNQDITAEKILLIDQEGEKAGILPRLEALSRAQAANLDLVQVAMQDNGVAVCRIMNYGKHLYEKKKKVQTQRKKQKRVQVKEIKFKPTTDEGDFRVKVNKAKGFLEVGDKVKISVQFRGREMMHKDIGMTLLHRVEKDLEDFSLVEQAPKLEGRQMLMVLAPKVSK
jgi:translation initiation factor IF-3